MDGARTPEAGVRTRAALAELPARMNRVSFGNFNELPSTLLSPTQSPDELVITQRGRRSAPVTWSPDLDLKRNPFLHPGTPRKQLLPSPSKLGASPRPAPRKRLILGEPEDDSFMQKLYNITTPEKLKIYNPTTFEPTPSKRPRVDRPPRAHKGPLDLAFKGLSQMQIINIVMNIVKKHPELEKEIKNELPAPDLGPLEQELNFYKNNIYKSLPTARFASKTGSTAYLRAAVHVGAFKKCLMGQGQRLVKSQYWSSVVEYVLMAWRYVAVTPVWDNQTNNMQRKQCFKALINFCQEALRAGDVEAELLQRLQERLPGMAAECEDARVLARRVAAVLDDAK